MSHPAPLATDTVLIPLVACLPILSVIFKRDLSVHLLQTFHALRIMRSETHVFTFESNDVRLHACCFILFTLQFRVQSGNFPVGVLQVLPRPSQRCIQITYMSLNQLFILPRQFMVLQPQDLEYRRAR